MTRHALSLVVMLWAGVACAQTEDVAYERHPLHDAYCCSDLTVGDWEVSLQVNDRFIRIEGPVTGVAFAPGSRELAYCTVNNERGSALWLAAVPEMSPREWEGGDLYVPSRLLWRAPAGASLSGPIRWSPRSEKLALQVTTDAATNVVSVDCLTGTVADLLHDTPVAELAWQPSGEGFAYAVEADGERDVWLQTEPPTEPRHLGKGGFDLRWTLEGRLNWRRSDGRWTLVSWDPVSGSAEELVTSVVPLSACHWSPDGSLCAELVDGDGPSPSVAIFEANNSTPDLEPLPGAGPASVLCWSPDSRLLLLLGREDYLLAVASRGPGPGALALAEAASPGSSASLLRTRASGLSYPGIVDPRAGPPAWSADSNYLAYFLPGEEALRKRYDSRVRHLIHSDEIVVQRLRHSFIKAPKETEVERIHVTNNMKNVNLAIQMYLADNHDVFPLAEDTEELTWVLDEYVRDKSVFMRPGTEDEVSFWYVVPPGLRFAEVDNAAEMPVAFVDYDPAFLIVAYGDGHVEDFDRTLALDEAFDAWWEEYQQIRAEDPTAQPPPFVPPS